jgi:hypothetical protein
MKTRNATFMSWYKDERLIKKAEARNSGMILDIVRYRLHTQLLSQTTLTQPGEVVEWLGAVQSQDYAGAKWALAQRLKNGITDSEIDKDFNEGKLLRTHLMRPTWHFVTPQDIRWLLKLTAPRVHAVNGFMYRSQGLDKAILKKGNATLEKALRNGEQLTRSEIVSEFQKAGLISDGNGVRMGYFLMHAELEGLICSGGRRGKQFTYALLEERVPPVKALTPDEALAELTRRYFATRGPATLQDFTWWSGLTMLDAKKGIEMVKSEFVNEVWQDQSYWFANSVSPVRMKSPTAHLLPNYDEYFIGFKDRSAIAEIAEKVGIKSDDPSLIAHIVILDGQIIGGWRRTIQKGAILVELQLFTQLTKAQDQAVNHAIEQYGKFLGLPIKLADTT